MSIKRKRIIDEFVEIVSMDSESFHERQAADLLTKKLKELGFEVSEDNAGSHYGGNAGNIYGFLKGNADKESILFSSHLDTVTPGKGKKAIIHDNGIITSDGSTVLGSDDAAGLVEILGGIRSVIESGAPHGDIEVLFPIAEEVYLKGTNKFDFNKIKSRIAYVLDVSGDIGCAAVKAPSLISFNVTVKGRAAHAGFSPESGINAIAIAAKAVADLEQGRIDDETTFNIGTISGGTATNIVSEICTIKGEVRSFNHSKALDQIEKLKSSFSNAVTHQDATFTLNTSVDLIAYELEENSPVIEKFLNACHGIGIEGKLISTFGGSDNHNFMKNGINGTVISCGMYNVHSVNEYTKVDELIKGSKLVEHLILY